MVLRDTKSYFSLITEKIVKQPVTGVQNIAEIIPSEYLYGIGAWVNAGGYMLDAVMALFIFCENRSPVNQNVIALRIHYFLKKRLKVRQILKHAGEKHNVRFPVSENIFDGLLETDFREPFQQFSAGFREVFLFHDFP